MDSEKNFDKWFTNSMGFIAWGDCFYGDTPELESFFHIFNINKENVKPFTKDISYFLENNDQVIDVKWGVKAYFQFQDILAVEEDGNPLTHRHYCYYESLVAVRESIVSCLDQNILAGLVLLRPFLELSLMHLYWYIRCEHKGYKPYYDWFEGKKGKPPFKNQLDYIFSNLSAEGHISHKEIIEIKDAINNIYKSLCSYNHTPKLDESIINLCGGWGNISKHGFTSYWRKISNLLRKIVHLYILVYPMALFPVDRYQKWAFHGPLGLTFDKYNFAYLKMFIGFDKLSQLMDQLVLSEAVIHWYQWFNSLPDLDDKEIEKDWIKFFKEYNLFDTEDVIIRNNLYKANARLNSWFPNYLHEPTLARIGKQLRGLNSD